MKKRLPNLTPETVRAAAAGWFRDRVDLGPLLAVMAKKTVPIHRHSWIYLLGGAALFLFGLQVVSGALLMLYYQPTEAGAHQSVQKMVSEVPLGRIVRSVHAWGANFFIAVVVLHFLVKLFTKAYRKPRETTWISGMLLLLLALGFGFSGYLLPWTELSYYATEAGTAIPALVPVAGDWIEHFLRGSPEITGDTITRFYAAHVMFLPLVSVFFLAVHLGLIQAQGMGLPLGMPKEKVRDAMPFFSEFLLLDLCVWLVVFGAIVTLAALLPAELGGMADPLADPTEEIKPEWYFLFMFQTLKHVPETVSVALFALGAMFLLVLPFLDRNAMRERKSPGFTALFLLLVVYVVVFEILAWMAPGMEHAPEEPAAGSFQAAGSIVPLVLLWAVIGFLVFYLRQLLAENTRVRRLYKS